MKSLRKINRRAFLRAAGTTAAAGFIPGNIFGMPEISSVQRNRKHADAMPVPENRIAEIMETKVICKEPGKFLQSSYMIDENGHPKAGEKVMEPNRYLGWPSIVRTKNNELLVVYSGDRDAHVCPWGKTQLIRSSDNGKTWTKPITITSTQLDDRDAGIIQTMKGTLLVSWFTSLAYANPAWKDAYNKYGRVAEKIPEDVKKHWLGNWVRRSEDNGNTWLEPSRTVATAPHGPIQLRDGRLLYIGTGKLNDKDVLVAEQSEDDGRTWKVMTTFRTESGSVAGIYEPHVAELKNGTLIALFRNEPKDREKCFMLQSESFDGGKTWTVLHETPIWGYPPHLLVLRNGWLLVVYGHRREKYSERACISRDGGKTWDIGNEIILSTGPNGDLGYPASVQLSDDSILTVYYQQDVPGKPTSIMTTHWRLK